MKKSKFIPIAVLACLGVVAFAMNNGQCLKQTKSCIIGETQVCAAKKDFSGKNKGTRCKRRTCKNKSKKSYNKAQ